MSILHALVLGLVQGLTEFFPVSSSGHLVLTRWLFGWDDFAGNDHLAKAFDVAVHLGTLVGAVTYLASDVQRYTRAAFTRRGASDDRRIAWLLVLSAVPAAITGALLGDLVEALDDVIWLVGLCLIVFAVILWWADKAPITKGAHDFQLTHALAMGAGQALALQPGVSRSGVTISVARRLGFDRDTAARLSFLMSLPVIAGAGLYEGLSVAGSGGLPSEFVVPFAVAVLASGVSGWLAVAVTLRIVRTHSFTPFVIYRIALGVFVLVTLATGLW